METEALVGQPAIEALQPVESMLIFIAGDPNTATIRALLRDPKMRIVSPSPPLPSVLSSLESPNTRRPSRSRSDSANGDISWLIAEFGSRLRSISARFATGFVSKHMSVFAHQTRHRQAVNPEIGPNVDGCHFRPQPAGKKIHLLLETRIPAPAGHKP
jgi:hypothetical protein